MTTIHFTKMHGAGNDFVVLDNRSQAFSNDEIISLAPELCHRRFGIGADGIMALQTSENDELDYTMFYRNADGSDAGMCGNGARCLALFAAKCGLGTDLRFNVHDKIYRAEVKPEEKYATIHFLLQVDVREINQNDDQTLYQLYAGTEHLVQEVSPTELENEDQLRQTGRKLRYDERFDPPGTNVNFICGKSPEELEIKTYERGVEDLTLACGTGAIAAALTWHHRNHHPEKNIIVVQAQGGTLKVGFVYNASQDNYSEIKLSGKCEFVFEGDYEL